MSFHSKNYGLEPTEKQFFSWVGDAALLFIARLVLTEKYPFLPIKLLMSRERHLVENYALNNYCKRNNLPFGCNHLEIEINELVLNGEINKAKEIILDILKYSDAIKSMDYQQITDGKINEKFKIQLVEKYKTREQIAEKHNQIRNSDLHWTQKKELHKQLKAIS